MDQITIARLNRLFQLNHLAFGREISERRESELIAESIVKINTFDDGNQQWQNYPNTWKVLARHFNGDKLSLQNIAHPNIVIQSISAWKTEPIQEPSPHHNVQTLLEIHTFDDGNEQWIQYPNSWKIIGHPNHGKVTLQNVSHPEIIIRSISQWKTREIQEKPNPGLFHKTVNMY